MCDTDPPWYLQDSVAKNRGLVVLKHTFKTGNIFQLLIEVWPGFSFNHGRIQKAENDPKYQWQICLFSAKVCLQLAVDMRTKMAKVCLQSQTNSLSIWRTKMAKIYIQFTDEFAVNMAE